MGGQRSETLAGRSAELEQVREVLLHTRRGDPQIVLVRGDAGVGKTRLLQEIAGVAADLGFRSVVGRADDVDRRVPFAALRLSLGPELDAEDSPRLAPVAATLRDALHLAALPETTSGSSSPTGTSGSPAVFELLYRVLSGWAEIGPVLVAVDDLHNADADTRAAFRFLSRHLQGRVVLVATTRAYPPDLDVELAAMVEQLAGSGSGCMVDLVPLDQTETAELVRSRLGHEPPPELVDQIWRSATGNPFFTIELLRARHDQGLADDALGAVSAGPAVLHRIFRLGAPAQSVAQAVSVLSRAQLDDLAWVAEAVDLDPPEVEVAFDLLVSAHVLERVGDGYRFVHPIVRDTIYQDLGPATRWRWHSSFAADGLRQRDEGRPVDIVDVAQHLRAGHAPDGVRAHEIFVEAGDTALGAAPRGAATWYEDALRAMPLDSGDRGEVLARLARAHFLASRKAQAATVAREALALLPPGRLRSAMVSLCINALQTGGQYAEALELFDDHAGECSGSARMLAHRAQLLLWLDRIDEAEAEADRAVELAGPAGDYILDGTRLHLLWTVGRPAEARALAAHVRTKLGGYDDLARRASLLALVTSSVYNGGDHRGAADALAELGEAVFQPGIVRAAAVNQHMLRGDWDEALALAALAETELGAGDRAFLPLLLDAVAHMRAERGEVADSESLRARLRSAGILPASMLVAIGHLDMAVGALDSARAALRQSFDRHRRVGRIGPLPYAALLLAEVEMATGRPAAAERVCAELDTAAPLDALGPRGQAWAHLTHAVVRGDAEAAQQAAAVAGEAGLAFEQARGLHLHGALTRNGDELVEAAETFRRLRARVRERDARQALRQLGRDVPRKRRDGRLTETERQLAQLVGQGMTNRQIAAVVHLSPRTIETYLSRLYAKVGCASRVDLAVALSSGRLDLQRS